MDCIFCDIVKGDIPAKIVAENKGAIAFLDANPISDGHTIIIPKKHYKNFSECKKEEMLDVMDLTQKVSNILKNSPLKPGGFNYLSNEGSIAGQQVMHFHFHIIPKYAKNEGLKMEVEHKYIDDIDKVYKKIIKSI